MMDWSDGLKKQKARLDEVSSNIIEKQAEQEKIEMFLTELERQDGIVTEFDENLWYSLLNYVTVFNVLFCVMNTSFIFSRARKVGMLIPF